MVVNPLHQLDTVHLRHQHVGQHQVEVSVIDR
jgi:hypothetical protein